MITLDVKPCAGTKLSLELHNFVTVISGRSKVER